MPMPPEPTLRRISNARGRGNRPSPELGRSPSTSPDTPTRVLQLHRRGASRRLGEQDLDPPPHLLIVQAVGSVLAAQVHEPDRAGAIDEEADAGPAFRVS